MARMTRQGVRLLRGQAFVAAIMALCAAAACAAPAKAAPLGAHVQTALGWIKGERSTDDLLIFRGVPFAAAPVGDLRWRPPTPAKPWPGVRSARTFSHDCAQTDPQAGILRRSEYIGDVDRGFSEDCLYLNVWTRAHSGSERHPVMVWIYGGGFQQGSGAVPEYDGERFARQGVVLVTINYRVGVFGFLVHPGLTAESSHHTSGNYGVLDQIAALKWVKQNIAAFGGDPTRVTIFGESAGSTAVNILQSSPLAKGLFERVIGESTSQMDAAGGLLGRQTLRQAEQYGSDFAQSLGAQSIAALRKLPTAALLKPDKVFWPQDADGYVLPEDVYQTFAEGKQNNVPTLVGWNAAEGASLRVPWITPKTPEEINDFGRLYPNPGDNQIYTDTVAWQMQSWSDLQARTGGAPAYLYVFDQDPPPSKVAPPGPIHGSEMVYVFQSFDRVRRSWTNADRRTGALMADYWINFAKTGDPNGPGLPRWPAYNPASPEVMILSSPPGAAPAPRQAAFKLIDAYFARRRETSLDPPGPAASILNLDLSRNGPNVAASVPDMVADPRDPARIAVIWRSLSMPKATEDLAPRVWICHLALSSDGGAHFVERPIDWKTPDSPLCNAPYVDIDRGGDLIIGATLSARSPNTRAPGYMPLGRVSFRRSKDWGRTWSQTQSIIATGDQARFAPNASVPDEAERIPWDGARGVADRDNGDIYVSGGYPAPPGGAAYSQRFYSASLDGGVTWGPIRAFGAPGWPQRWDGHIVAAHGELAFSYVAAAAPGADGCPCVVFGVSADHGVAVERHLVARIADMDTLVHYPPIAADPSRRGVFALAFVSPDGKQIELLTSSDNGASWAPAASPAQPGDIVRVSRPALAYTPGGALVLLWRGYHGDGSFDIYAAGARDDVIFGAPLRITTAASRIPGALMSDYAVRGDFINVAATDSRFLHAAWTDWRSGAEAQVYYGRVPLARLLSRGP